ncbi:multidrug transporter [Pedobacter lusitanus]|uniref:Multidrug transporter n=1 Tax=Pedobacter lusitanus TaxID=1503925 RepID=A0A0D0GT74_9SPHI|nr:multidrug transporter [Pedobacter lusitanus]
MNTPEEKKKYNRINVIAGFILFSIALLTYWLTMEPTASFYDCGEFIATANRLQVGHQPGAPLFLMIGKLFSLLAMGNTANIAYWINFSAVLASATTIMFLFWTITALAAKVYRREKIGKKTYSIIAAGAIGALAYTFSDTFWFSAVESEVYALSSLFTAVTFWAILRWESDTNNRWLVFISFIVGLSIGVHLLSLLTIPAVTLVYYFKKTEKPGLIGITKAFLTGCVIVGIVQFVLIQYFVLFAARTDLLFVNTFGLFFGSGALFFVLMFAILMYLAIHYSVRRQKYNLNMGLLCLVFILFGFSSYLMILIRADAKTNINLSNPDQPFSLYEYLGRVNYGSTPLVYGNTFDAKVVENKETGNTYRKGTSKYEISGKTYKTTYDKNMLFPRTFSQKPGHDKYYQQWLNLSEGQTPTFTQNLTFFTSWQLNYMYWRYFLWNFVGRQNDIQGHGGIENGNWISGIKTLDAIRLGNQSDLPATVTTNAAHNVYYGFPLILGIAGLIWLYRRNKTDVIVILTLFFFTGIAIILYLNQDPLQPRERDYAYVGSFYAFAIFIGFGVLAVKEILSRVTRQRLSLIMATGICLLTVPVLMGIQGWDDHDRSHKSTATDWAKNYLNSCAPNAILFTNADNDTFPLWYAQEVEGFRTDVRVICMQFLPDASFINQLKKRVNNSAPLPISMGEEKYVSGVRDYLPYVDYGLTDSVELKDLFSVMTSDNKEDQVQMTDGSFMNFLPARKLKLTVDAEQLVKTHTITPAQKANVAKTMEWSFNKSYVSKGDLALFDILVHNNWERPIYFATSVSEDTYAGLDKYLYLEGYAYRLLPFKSETNDLRDKSDKTNSDVMYSNVMNKIDYSGFHKASYLDQESKRIVFSTWGFNNTLAANLIMEGKPAQATRLLQKCLKDLPLNNYTVRDTINRIYTIQNLYALNHQKEANLLTKQTTDFLAHEFNYVCTLSPEFQQGYLQNTRISLYVLGELDKLTAGYKQQELNKTIKSIYSQMIDQSGISRS